MASSTTTTTRVDVTPDKGFEGGEVELVVSAPAKVILHGEHSVVYGRLAVAGALDLRTRLHLSEARADENDPHLNLWFHDVHRILSIPLVALHKWIKGVDFTSYNFEHPESLPYAALVRFIESFIHTQRYALDSACTNSLIAFLYLFVGMFHASGVAPTSVSLKVHVSSEIKVAAGMGSSASFAVCAAAAIMRYITAKYSRMPDAVTETHRVLTEVAPGQPFTARELRWVSAWALQAERVIHGNPSGIDNTVCTFGGVVAFQKDGGEPEVLSLKHSMKSLLWDTGLPKDTKEQVKKVAHKRSRLTGEVERTFDKMDAIARKAVVCIRRMDEPDVDIAELYDQLGGLFDENQAMLKTLGVSLPIIDEICENLAKMELHGKITGAGGGGYVLALIPPDKQTDVKLPKNTIVRRIGCSGVQIDCFR